jgi:hypothetical protein
VQFLRLVGILRGEVVLFADVLRDVVEFQRAVFIPLDELPIAIADGAIGRSALVGIMRIVPEKRLTERKTDLRR